MPNSKQPAEKRDPRADLTPWIPWGPTENTAQVQDRDPFHIFENASRTRRAGCAKVRPKPCTTGDRATAGPSAKITLSAAIIYVYIDWAQTGVDARFYRSGCTGIWG